MLAHMGFGEGTSPSRPQDATSPNLGSPRKPSGAGCVGKGGARERTQFSPQAETELSGLCDDARTAPDTVYKCAVRNGL